MPDLNSLIDKVKSTGKKSAAYVGSIKVAPGVASQIIPTVSGGTKPVSTSTPETQGGTPTASGQGGTE